MGFEAIKDYAFAAVGQALLAGMGVGPEAMATRIDTGSDSPVFRRWLDWEEVAVQVFFDPRVNLILLRNLAGATKQLAGALNGKDTDYVYRTERVGVSFDDHSEPWHWRVNPLRRLGLTLWEGEPRGFMIKPFIAWPRLADYNFPGQELVCSQVARAYYGGRPPGRIRVVPANVRLDFSSRELVIIKPYTKLIK